MDAPRPEFVPDPSLSRAEMETLQREIAAAATFADDLDGLPGERATDDDRLGGLTGDRRPLVAGVDPGFSGDTATSAVVAVRDGAVVERVHASEETEIPYIPGLLSFREGGAVLSAFEELESDPDVVLVDGSGRIHFR
jgi:deoxyribonuclease V